MLGLPQPQHRMNPRFVPFRPVLPTNPLLLKARKNFDLPTDCIPLLNSTKYRKLGGKTIKLLLSQHAKKKPFAKISLGPKIPPKAKIIGRDVKNFSYFTESQDPEFQKPEKRLLRFIAHSYKHLQCLDAWKDQFCRLKNLESLCLVLASPCQKVLQWISQLSLKSLKSYHFKLQDQSREQKGGEEYHRSFLLKWSENLQNFSSLEDLSIEITSFRLDSLDFITKSLSNLPTLKRIRLHLNLHNKQPKEKLKLSIPCENLPQLEQFWLKSYQFLSKDSAPKLLQEIVKCKNLQSLKISGLDFDEAKAISTVRKLRSLKELAIYNERKDILSLFFKKKIIKHNSLVHNNCMLI